MSRVRIPPGPPFKKSSLVLGFLNGCSGGIGFTTQIFRKKICQSWVRSLSSAAGACFEDERRCALTPLGPPRKPSNPLLSALFNRSFYPRRREVIQALNKTFHSVSLAVAAVIHPDVVETERANLSIRMPNSRSKSFILYLTTILESASLPEEFILPLW